MPTKADQKDPGTGGMVVRPGALGSPQSPAAARAVLARRFAERKRVDIIIVSNIPRPRRNGITIGQWTEGEDGSLTRFSILPAGMTMEEAEEIASRDVADTVATTGLDGLSPSERRLR